MTRSVIHGKFLVLSKDGINDIFRNEEEYSYKIIQIEHGFDDDYIVEVVEKCPRVKIEPTLDNIVKTMRGDKV